MGKTMAEKILARCSGEEKATAGDIVIAKADCAMMDDILGPRIMDEAVRRYNRGLHDPDRCVVICDHYAPAGSINQADIVSFTRKWAKEYGIKNYFESMGPCHQILAENGFSLPGTLQVGTDSHTCMAGAFGCFGTGIGSTEMASVVLTGEIWLRIPESIRILWNKKLPFGVMAKDLILKTIGDLGHAGATYMSLEFAGETIQALPMDERMCISNMAVEAGAKAGLIAADEITESYLKDHGCHKNYSALYADLDASYVKTLEYDADFLVPQVAAPHNVDNVHPITELAGTPIDRAYLGSCTGGRLNDLKAAADIVRGKKIASNCMFFVSPASQRIWEEADRLRILGDLAAAGAIILAPTCGACVGTHSGLLGAGERCISTTNRNFKGRMGSKDSFVYLASPVTVAATALTGKLCDPREYAA
ncbi:3-isopropylmalate dehydratase large subunit [Synergistales bacterium]|nr:3-isopropylmalate dehydratase large subunit [Synergistales bacterium]